MDCNCSVDVDGDCEFISSKILTAKKDHVCCECGQKIKSGEKYQRYSGKQDSCFFHEKTCIPCNSIRKRYCPDGYYFGELRDRIMECLGMDYVTGEIEDWAEGEDSF